MKSRILTSFTAMTVFAALAISIRLSAQEQQEHPSSTHQPTITTFDAPGAGTAAGQGTFGFGINPAGMIAGIDQDASNVYHGFLRTSDGTFKMFDAPGAGTGSGQGTLTASFSGLNQPGVIAGYYSDASNVTHGYVRAPDGTFTTFDAPGAGTGSGQGTIIGSLDP